MEKDIVIDIKNIEKSFKIYNDKGHTLKERLLFFKQRNSYIKHKVLNSISIKINKGDVIGLIGKNGCGKSTLLKLMTKIIYPDKGKIEIKGKVSSLLELGAGFHPDMTGRENIYTNASIFGLTKKEIDTRLDDIINFSELGEFIDSPVRTYSSGMYMRLAFSVAINVEADILLIDEILAVGDSNFQFKCFNKIQELKEEGKTIVIVSHDLGSIEKLCNCAIWIKSGFIEKVGNPKKVIGSYLSFMENETCRNKENFKGIIKNFRTFIKGCDENSKQLTISSNQDMRIHIEYDVDVEIEDVTKEFNLFRNDGILCCSISSKNDEIFIKSINNKVNFGINLKRLNLVFGEYYLILNIIDKNEKRILDGKRILDILVDDNNMLGIMKIEHKWETD